MKKRMLAWVLTLALVISLMPAVSNAASGYTTCASGTVSWQMIHDNPNTYYWIDGDGYYCALTGTKSGSYYYVTLYRPEKSNGTELRYLRQNKSDDSGSKHEWSGANAYYTGGVLYKSGSGSGSSGGTTNTTVADGTYTATSNTSFKKDGETYRATVTVTVSDGKIASLTASGPTTSEDNKDYFADALSGIKKEIVGVAATSTAGSTVDTVSGATKSSNLILEAINLALSGTSSGGGGNSSTPTYYTITFHANGHGTAPTTQTVLSGGLVTEPKDPAADGYLFAGWYTDQGCTSAYNFTNTVAKSFTLYAKWVYNGSSSGGNGGSGGSVIGLPDGTYTATSTSSYKKDSETYKATVKITVKDGKITSITATGPTSSKNKSYLEKALSGISSQIVGEDATKTTINGIDAVSKATNSSKLIKEAILLALGDAPESNGSSTTTGDIIIVNPGTVTGNNLSLSKELSYVEKNDSYEIKLKGWATGKGNNVPQGYYVTDGWNTDYSFDQLSSGNYYYYYNNILYSVKAESYTYDKTRYAGYIEIDGVKYYLDNTLTTKTSDKPGKEDTKKIYSSAKSWTEYINKNEKAPLYVKTINYNSAGLKSTSRGSVSISYKMAKDGGYFYYYNGSYYELKEDSKSSKYYVYFEANNTTYYLKANGDTTTDRTSAGNSSKKDGTICTVTLYNAPVNVVYSEGSSGNDADRVLKDTVNTTVFDLSNATVAVTTGSASTPSINKTSGLVTVTGYDYSGNFDGTPLTVTISGLKAKVSGATYDSNTGNAGIYSSNDLSSPLVSVSSPKATIPQKETVSYTVTFQVKNGTWNDGTTNDKTVTVSGYKGQALYLTSSQIPAVGTKPNAGYVAGGWNTEPKTDRAITGNTTYVYTYARNPSSIKDGTYGDYSYIVEGENVEVPYYPIVVITVKDGKIIDITVDADTDKDNMDCLDEAIDGIREQLKGQPVTAADNIDVVSGATLSSEAIIKEIQKALSEDPKGPYTLTVKDEDGNIIEEHSNVTYGTRTAYELEEPAKKVDDKVYTFTGWKEPLETFVTKDKEYTALYSVSDAEAGRRNGGCRVQTSHCSKRFYGGSEPEGSYRLC